MLNSEIPAGQLAENPSGFKKIYRELLRATSNIRRSGDSRMLRDLIENHIQNEGVELDRFGFSPLVLAMATATELCNRVSPDRNMVLAVMLFHMMRGQERPEALKEFDPDVVHLIEGLSKVTSLYSKQAAVKDENFSKLLLTFANDIRVIIIMIVERVVLMRAINHHPAENLVREVALEANYLYAPLAHRLGLYKLKSDLEDMSLKYTNRDMYSRIANKLNATKKTRDIYIAAFIKPIKEELEKAGLKFDIKGRTKSIYSIWNKMKKQNTDVEHIYDLFAIRVIIDSPDNRQTEHAKCWLAYSIVTNMYQPNPARMKDWLSIPKTNGYESLHTTVRGPEDKWVEIQIRTRRMDEIAEKGIAAHWKYKGITSENNLDMWMNQIRDILEAGESGPMELMKNMQMDLYHDEVFVFTPRGDLHKLPLGATVLDFAFSIHSKLGCSCVGGKVNDVTRKINYKLKSGDTVEILTSNNQTPKQDWLGFVVTQKARNKIRQTIKERENRAAEIGKELLQRRLKNRKIDLPESELMKTIKQLGFKTVTEFFKAIGEEKLDVNDVIAAYEQQLQKAEASSSRSAEEFTLNQPSDDEKTDDVLIIGENVKGMNYRMAKCCNPINGDKVFGFISQEGVVKIHREDCPNAKNIRARYPYRIINTRWSGKLGKQFIATLNILGNDDIGIVSNISSIINKERDATLRNISIESTGALFRGYIVVGISDTESLNSLIKKLKTVKGVKNVERNN